MVIVKSVLFIFSSVWRLVFTLLFIGSLFINVTMFAWSAGAIVLSKTVSAVTGITSIVTDLADSKAKLAASQKQVGELNKKITKTKKQVGGLTRKIGIRTGRSVVRSVASIPAEAIPFIGVATTITITGLEIKDACATMKDLEELNRLLDRDADIDAETTCGLKVPDKDTVIGKVIKSPKTAYESAMSADIPLPSWSNVTATTKRGWDGLFKNLNWLWDWLWDWLFKD